MKKIGLIGFFNYGIEDIGGQVLKTRNYETILKRRYGNEDVICLDRLEGRNNPVKYMLHFIKMLCTTSAVLLFPTERMLRTFVPIILVFRSIFRFKLIYIVIGGWLPSVAKNDSKFRNLLKEMDIIYAETKEMEYELRILGIQNVDYIPNFSMRNRLEKHEFDNVQFDDSVFKLCTYSRVTKEKGIIDAIQAVHQVNKNVGRIVCTLDVYGQVWPDFEREFLEEVLLYPDEVAYRGIIKGDEALRELAKHQILLFPTYYKGEGFPGTLVEALMAGVPVIASDWHYNADIIEDGYSGMIYSLDDAQGLYKSVEKMIENKAQLSSMRVNAYNESKKYLPETVMNGLYNTLES